MDSPRSETCLGFHQGINCRPTWGRLGADFYWGFRDFIHFSAKKRANSSPSFPAQPKGLHPGCPRVQGGSGSGRAGKFGAAFGRNSGKAGARREAEPRWHIRGLHVLGTSSGRASRCPARSARRSLLLPPSFPAFFGILFLLASRWSSGRG